MVSFLAVLTPTFFRWSLGFGMVEGGGLPGLLFFLAWRLFISSVALVAWDGVSVLSLLPVCFWLSASGLWRLCLILPSVFADGVPFVLSACLFWPSFPLGGTGCAGSASLSTVFGATLAGLDPVLFSLLGLFAAHLFRWSCPVPAVSFPLALLLLTVVLPGLCLRACAWS